MIIFLQFYENLPHLNVRSENGLNDDLTHKNEIVEVGKVVSLSRNPFSKSIDFFNLAIACNFR